MAFLEMSRVLVFTLSAHVATKLGSGAKPGADHGKARSHTCNYASLQSVLDTTALEQVFDTAYHPFLTGSTVGCTEPLAVPYCK